MFADRCLSKYNPTPLISINCIKNTQLCLLQHYFQQFRLLWQLVGVLFSSLVFPRPIYTLFREVEWNIPWSVYIVSGSTYWKSPSFSARWLASYDVLVLGSHFIWALFFFSFRPKLFHFKCSFLSHLEGGGISSVNTHHILSPTQVWFTDMNSLGLLPAI